MEQYSYITNLSKYPFQDIYVTKLLLFYDNEDHTLELTTCDSADWGMPSTLVVKTSETFPLPLGLEMRWISPAERKVFEIAKSLDQARTEDLWKKQKNDYPDNPFRQYMIGVAPYGGVAIWLCNSKKSVFVQWLQAEEKPLVLDEDDEAVLGGSQETLNAMMPLDKLQNNMRQHHYRFVPLEEYFDSEGWQKYSVGDGFYEAIELDGVEVKRLDGTFDYTDCDDVLHYHEAGKPCRITVRWYEGDSSFFAHFWLDETETTFFFNGFSNTFPDAQADLLLRIDRRAERYEIALTGEGLPTRTMKHAQYVVFKDYVEISRSKNYTKKDGEWRWFS